MLGNFSFLLKSQDNYDVVNVVIVCWCCLDFLHIPIQNCILDA